MSVIQQPHNKQEQILIRLVVAVVAAAVTYCSSFAAVNIIVIITCTITCETAYPRYATARTPSDHSWDTASNWPYSWPIVMAFGLITVHCTRFSSIKPWTHIHTQNHLRPFIRNYLGGPVPEKTFTHSHPSWSSDILYQLSPSTTIYSILLVQFMCLTVLFHNLFSVPHRSIRPWNDTKNCMKCIKIVINRVCRFCLFSWYKIGQKRVAIMQTGYGY